MRLIQFRCKSRGQNQGGICGDFARNSVCLEPLVDFMRSGQQSVIVTVGAYQLQPGGQAHAAPPEGQVDAGQAQQGPGTAKDRVTGAAEPGGCLADAAGGQQDVVVLKQVADQAASA